MDDLSDELAGALAARRELGPDAEQAAIAAFLERTNEAIERKVDARVAAHLALNSQPAAPARGDAGTIGLALGSIALGIPIMGIATQFPSVVALLVALIYWIAVAIVNVSYHHRSRG